MVSRTPANGTAASATRSTTGLRDVLQILFRHRRKMTVFFLSAMTLVVLGLIFYPRKYTSDARLFVRLGKESVGLDPTATISQTVTAQTNRENEIESEMEILRSRALLEEVVDRLGPDYVMNGAKKKSGNWMNVVLAPVHVARTWLSGEISPKEAAVAKLSKMLKITSPRKSNIIIVTSQGIDPSHAQRTLQTLLDSFQIQHAKANRTAGSYEFFHDQSQLLGDELTKVNEELRQTKNRIGLVSLEGQRQNVQLQATSIEAAILENQRALAQAEAKIAALEASLKELPEQLTAEQTAGLPNAAADLMRNELYRLQILEKEASSRFTSLHPHVIAVRRQVAETEKILDEQEASRQTTTKRLSPVHQAVQTELMSAQAVAAAERAKAESLKQQQAGIKNKIESLNDNEFRVAELTRRSELIEASYRDYFSNREQARVDKALELGRISNVNLVQPASFVAMPSSPRMLLTLILGCFASLFGSVLLAFACEQLDPSLKTQQQVENELGVPVLFSVPRNNRHEFELLSN
jgi:uncharacterized protein involved in exopolysaccharide biosynthesis